MSVAFWSIALTNKASKEVEIPEGYVLNVQQAALTGAAKGSQVIKVSTLAIDGDKLESVIGTLRAGTVDQTTVSLVFGYDVPVTFSTTGDANGTVYLSGYFQPGPDGDSDEEGDEYGDFDDEEGDSEDEEEGSEEDDDEEDDQEGNAKNALAAIKKLANAKKIDLKSNSKGKVEELNDESVSDDEDSSEDEDDSEDEKDEAFIKKMNAKLSSGKMDASDSEEEDSEEDDSEEEEDDSESESEEEAPPMKVQKTAPKGTVTPSGKQQQQQQQKPSTPAAKPSTPAAKAFGGDNNKPKTPQQAPQSANKPNNNNNNNNNKTPQNKPNNNNNNNNQKSGNKFPQSGDKRKHG